MTEQQGNPRRSIALAIVLFVVAVGAFAAAFYLLDGYALVQELTGGTTVEAVDSPGNTGETTSQVATDTLTLPEGMPKEFALRIWQEQVDSQENIVKLLQGEIEKLVVTGHSQDGAEAVLEVSAKFSDGTSAPGRIVMYEYGETWYFASISGARASATGGSADTVALGNGEPSSARLPSIEDVDVELLNTMLAEQVKSSEVTAQYASGAVEEVRITGDASGPRTSAISVEMLLEDEVVPGDVIALLDDSDGQQLWFIARFSAGSGSE